MRIAIWGAGGIGCYYGAKLQKAGHKVSYIARGEHLKVMQSQGLTLQHPSFNFCEHVEALSQEQWKDNHHCSDFDLIILTLKSTATEHVMQEMAGWLVEGSCPILSLQNGVDNEIHIANTVGIERTLGGLAVKIGGHTERPGHIKAEGIAQVIFGQWPQEKSSNLTYLNSLLSTFVDAQIEARSSPEIRVELWKKLIINNGVNPISALTELDTKQITSDPILRENVHLMMKETAAAAKCDGVELTQEDVTEMLELISQFNAIKTSMLVDFEKGRPLENAAISGAVIERSKRLGINAPVTELINKLLLIKCENRD